MLPSFGDTRVFCYDPVNFVVTAIYRATRTGSKGGDDDKAKTDFHFCSPGLTGFIIALNISFVNKDDCMEF